MPKKRKGSGLTRHEKGADRKQGTASATKAQERDARAAAAALHAMRTETRSQAEPEPTDCEQHVQEPITEPKPKRRKGIDETRRRHAIHELYVNLGEPEPSKWKGRGGTVSKIRESLRLPAGADRCIFQVLERIVDPDVEFDGGRRSGGGRHAKLSLAEAMIAADELESGVGQTQATISVNVWRAKQRPPKSEVCRATVVAAAVALGAEKRRRLKRKCGSTDPNDAWSKARLAQVQQFLAQLRAGRREGVCSLKPIHLYGIAFWDEKHKKVRMGCSSKWQWRVPRGPDGAYLSAEEGGKLAPPLDVTTGKYEDEARGCFGVAMKQVNGVYIGHRFKPFNYTGWKVLGPTSYWAAIRKELERVEELTGSPWNLCCNPECGDEAMIDVYDGGRYEFLHGDKWRQMVDKHLKLCCITDIIDHIINEGNTFYADTPYANTWIIGHDALGQYWEPAALKHLEGKGFPRSRLLCAQGGTNWGTRYEGKLVGNSPELMPLDSNLFSDLEYAIKQHCALTHDLANDDPRKFKLGTPSDVWSALKRSWECIRPSRIVTDIKRWESALGMIFNFQGCLVHDLNNRHGRSAVPFEYHKDCAESVRVKQEKWKSYAQYATVPLPA